MAAAREAAATVTEAWVAAMEEEEETAALEVAT